MLALHIQNRLATGGEKTKVILVNRRADADQIADAAICDSHFQTNPRAKREPAKRDGLVRILLDQVIERDPHIVPLAATLVMPARTLAHTAKINTQGYQPGLVQGACCAKHNFIVHCSPTQRMRMKHESGAVRGPDTWLFQNCLKFPVRGRNKEVPGRIHNGYMTAT